MLKTHCLLLKIAMVFFDHHHLIITLTCYFRCHRAGSQLKILYGWKLVHLAFVQAVDDFDYYTPEALEETVRHERDGGSHGRSRAGRQQGRRPAPPQADYDDYDYQQEQEPRGGRQTGEVGVALGVLNSPPSADGRYNFK